MRSHWHGEGSTLQAVFRALESRTHDWNLVYDSTLPPDGALHSAATVYRGKLNRMGAVGVADFLHSSQADEPLDADLATHLWYGIVSGAVAWWRHHPQQSADDMTARFERILAALQP